MWVQSPLRAYRVLLILCLLAAGRAVVADAPDALRLIDRLQERLAQCHDYQYVIRSFERDGNRQETRSYRLFVKDCRLVRIKVVEGRGKGSEAVVDAQGRVRGRRGGLLKPFAETLKPEDHRIRSLRGTPFWEAACHNFLKDLRLRVTDPGTHSDVEPDPDEPSRLLLCLKRPPNTCEKYWIDPRQMQLVRGELFEGDVLVQEFSINEIKENVGLSDGFFSF
jgi:outer membrane lipoprotein-sorting protein